MWGRGYDSETGCMYCYSCGNSQNTIKVPRSVISLSLCSDRFPHRCLKGIIRVIRAVIFEVAIFLLLSLFWTNHQPQHQPSTTASQQPPPPPTSLSNNRFRPTVLPPPQPHAPLNKPRHPHHLNHNANHNYANHLTTFPATSTTDHLLHNPAATLSACKTVSTKVKEQGIPITP